MKLEGLLEFPEIQNIQPVAETVEDNDEAGLLTRTHDQPRSQTRGKFSNAAFRVMSKIALERKRKQAEDDDGREDKLPAIAGAFGLMQKGSIPETIVTSEPTRDRKSTSDFRDLVHSRSRFASLVRLANFRRSNALLAARMAGDHRLSRSNSQADLDELENAELPSKPCFGATLSPEAQYAMLKGYEDILFQHIRDAESLEQQRSLCRVKTPHRKVVALHLSEVETSGVAGRCGVGDDVQSIALGSQSSYLSERNLHRYVLNREHSKKLLLPEIGRHPRPNQGHQYNRPPVSRKVTKLDFFKPNVSKEKQLRLTYRFQRAMDILDTLKTSQGLLVTSSRHKSHAMRPAAVTTRSTKPESIQTDSYEYCIIILHLGFLRGFLNY